MGEPSKSGGSNKGEAANGASDSQVSLNMSYPNSPEKYVHIEPSVSPGGDSRRTIDDTASSHRDHSNDPQYVNDLRSAFTSIPRPKPRWQDRYMKLMIVGETGQGKTTFIKNMFASYAQDPDLKVNDVSAPTSKEEFINQPDKLCTEIVVSDEKTMTRFHYKVQDTPGYDSMEINMDPILAHINLCNEKALAREQDSKRNVPLAQDDDPRVDVCIYFLSPHRVKPIDMKFMTELSALAPVIPVLAKADSMTTGELKQFRKGVTDALSQASKNAKRDVAFRFAQEQLEDAGVRSGAPPFAIVASNVMDVSVGSVHSDLAALKKLLFEVMYEEFKQHTELRYYKFRQNTLFNLDDPNRPVHRLTLAEQLQRTLRIEKKGGFGRLLGKIARTALSGIAVYVAVNILSGKAGQKRLRQDFAIVAEKTTGAADVMAEKAGEAGQVAAARGKEAAEFTKDVAIDVKDSVTNRAEAQKRKAEEEKIRKKGRGPFGLF